MQTISITPQFSIKSSLSPQILLQNGLLFYLEKKFSQTETDGTWNFYYYLTCINALTKKTIKSVAIAPYLIHQFSDEENTNPLPPPKLFFANHKVFATIDSKLYCYKIQSYSSRVELLKDFHSTIFDGTVLPYRHHKLMVIITQNGKVHLYSPGEDRVVREYKISDNIQRAWYSYDGDSGSLFLGYETWRNGRYLGKLEVIPVHEEAFNPQGIDLDGQQISTARPIGRVSTDHLLMMVEVISPDNTRKLRIALYNFFSHAIEMVENFKDYELLGAVSIDGGIVLHLKETLEVNTLSLIDNSGTIISRQELKFNDSFKMRDVFSITTRSKHRSGILAFNRPNAIRIGEIVNDIVVVNLKFLNQAHF